MQTPNKPLKNQQNIKYSEMFSNLKGERTQKFITIVLTLITLSLFGLFAINPTLSTIAKLQKELSDSEFVHQQLQIKINNLSLLQQQYSKIENDLPVIYSAIPQNPDVPILIAKIQEIAQNSNIKLNNLENFQVELFKQNLAKEKYYSYSFSFEGRGSKGNIENFIEEIVNIDRIIDLDLVSVNKTTNPDGSLRLNIQGIAYYKK